MTQKGEVLERGTTIGDGQSVPSAEGRARVAMSAGRKRFAAYVAHELGTPIALQRVLVEVTLADPTQTLPPCGRWASACSRVVCGSSA